MQGRRGSNRKGPAFANIIYTAGRQVYATKKNFSALPRKMDRDEVGLKF